MPVIMIWKKSFIVMGIDLTQKYYIFPAKGYIDINWIKNRRLKFLIDFHKVTQSIEADPRLETNYLSDIPHTDSCLVHDHLPWLQIETFNHRFMPNLPPKSSWIHFILFIPISNLQLKPLLSHLYNYNGIWKDLLFLVRDHYYSMTSFFEIF